MPTAPDAYRAMLIDELTTTGTAEYDPLVDYTIAELEEVVIASGLPMPLVVLPAHYERDRILVPNRGMVARCACTAEWVCPLSIVIPPIVPEPDTNDFAS